MRTGTTILSVDSSDSNSNSNSTTSTAELVRQMTEGTVTATQTATSTATIKTNNREDSKEQEPSCNKANNSSPSQIAIIREFANAIVKALITKATTEEMKPAPPSTKANFINSTFVDFDIDSNGDPAGVFGIPWSETQAKDGLRPMAKNSTQKAGG